MKKKVLYFIPEFPRLTETFIEREISKLVNLGNLDLTVFSFAKASGNTSHEVLERTVYKRISVLDVFLSLPFIISKSKLIKKLWEVYTSEKEGSFFSKIFFFYKSIIYCYIFEKFKPDHIHCHFVSYPSTIAFFASNLLNVSYSISGHAKDVFVEAELCKTKAETAKFISICNKNAYLKFLELAGGVDRANVHLIFHGVDSSAIFEPSNTEKLALPMIYSIARLVEKKGLSHLIEASKILFDNGIKHYLFIAGPGPLYETLLKQINSYNLSEYIKILGEGKGISNKEAMKFMQQCDILVMNSLVTNDGDVDGVPTAVIEASLAKKPVVATNVGSIEDLITPETGVIVPQKDAAALAAALQDLIKNPQKGDALALRAYYKALEMFNLEKNVSKIDRLILE